MIPKPLVRTSELPVTPNNKNPENQGHTANIDYDTSQEGPNNL